MGKVPLSPKAIEFFELLLGVSDNFKKEVLSLMEKYGIKTNKSFINTRKFNLLKASKEARRFFNKEEAELSEYFEKDVVSLCSRYLVGGPYLKEIKHYVLTSIFRPLASLSEVKCTKAGIEIKTHYGVTRNEFEKIWEQINVAKEGFLAGENARKRAKTHSYFDLKLALYKKRTNAKYQPSEKEERLLASLEKTTKTKWLREVKGWAKELEYKSAL